MSGNTEQGKKAAETIKATHGADFYAKIGAMGGKKGKTGGFAWMKLHDPAKLSQIGAKGGKQPRRLRNV